MNDRLTAYAIVSSLERDTRDLIRILTNPNSLEMLVDQDLRERLYQRASADDIDPTDCTLAELLDYTDFSDASHLLRRVYKGTRLPDNITALCEAIEKLERIRKRVMHSRPLRPGDLAVAREQLASLVARSDLSLSASASTADRLARDPSFVLALDLPVADDAIYSNLPAPDYDDTGLVGRADDVARLTALLLSSRPVITLLGEGGVGKSAVAIETLSGLLDIEDLPYEAVVWTSLKTFGFGAAGISQIYRDIAGAHSIYAALESSILPKGRATLGDLIEYLDVIPTLLVIDNLETINVGDLRELFRLLPRSSKILVTSRIGIGEFEERYILSPLKSADSVTLLRLLATMLNVESLRTMDNKSLSAIAQELYFNPLALRWYVGSVANGGSPKPTSVQKTDLLRYCFSNVLNALDDPARTVLQIFQCARRPLTAGEIAFFVHDTDYLAGLNQLLRTSILRVGTNRATQRTVYIVTDFAAEFLRQEQPISNDFLKAFLKAEGSLSTAMQKAALGARHDKFKPWTVVLSTSGPDTAIAATHLQEAVVAAGGPRRDRERSLGFIERARRIAPEWCEVYKIAAYVYSRFDELHAADTQYQLALDNGGREHAHIVALYAQFLLRELQGRFEDALQLADEALKIERCAATLFIAARAHMYLGDIEVACDLSDEILTIKEKAGLWYARSALTTGIEACRRALEDDRNEPSLWFNRGLSYANGALHRRLWDEKLTDSTQRLLIDATFHLQRARLRNRILQPHTSPANFDAVFKHLDEQTVRNFLYEAASWTSGPTL
jgi:LuxR family glucitol operon transcriptional activator